MFQMSLDTIPAGSRSTMIYPNDQAYEYLEELYQKVCCFQV